MCPACLSTLALIAAGTGSAGGLAAVIVKKVRAKPEAQAPAHGTPAETPAHTEEIR